jgi:ribosomal protein S18 acetylase RimI-like enzyme
MKISIRQCTTSDLDTLQKIAYETFDESFRDMNTTETMEKYLSESFNKEKILTELSNPASKFYFLYADNKLTGYLKINEAPAQTDKNNFDSIEIERIYVRKEFKGKGLGKNLMNHAIQLAKEMKKNFIWLGVWEKNLNAIAFYKKMGFREKGKHSFQMGEELQTDLIMKKFIS